LIDAGITPAILRKLPTRWQKNAAVVAAAGLLGAIALSSCGISVKPKGSPGGERYLNVAPIFVHGEGMGSIGCVMIVPPVFISEQEALAIIKSEAESGGLTLVSKVPEFTATQNEAVEQQRNGEYKYRLGSEHVGLDLCDDEKGVALAYIPMQAAEKQYLPDEEGNWMQSTVISYLPRERAELAAGDFAKQEGDIAVGILYDPGNNWEFLDSYLAKTNEIWETYRSEEKYGIDEENADEYRVKMDEAQAEFEAVLKEQIEADLRAQVRDFIEWLQGQGII
ncbi:MAG: hypothetical protein FWG34_05590, partial [Oscillospiraceae bacterium]|nr:hypothetical protein [Oscillospiraceae bacterium]